MAFMHWNYDNSKLNETVAICDFKKEFEHVAQGKLGGFSEVLKIPDYNPV